MEVEEKVSGRRSGFSGVIVRNTGDRQYGKLDLCY
jgi:hypothetical protein